MSSSGVGWPPPEEKSPNFPPSNEPEGVPPYDFSLYGADEPSATQQIQSSASASSGSLPESLSDATQWYLQQGANEGKSNSNTWGGVTYTFSQTPDNSNLPKGSSSNVSGFWLSIETSGTKTIQSGKGAKEIPWSHTYNNQYYITCDDEGIYNGYTAYSADGQKMDWPPSSTHYQKSIPTDWGQFAQSNPAATKKFKQVMMNSMLKITQSMLSQLKQQLKQEQQEDWGAQV